MTNNNNIERLRDIIRRDMDLILAFLAQDQATAVDHLVRFSNSQGIALTASQISAALAAKQGRLQTLGAKSGNAVVLGHHPNSTHSAPF